jgi:hypothetical protein
MAVEAILHSSIAIRPEDSFILLLWASGTRDESMMCVELSWLWQRVVLFEDDDCWGSK